MVAASKWGWSWLQQKLAMVPFPWSASANRVSMPWKAEMSEEGLIVNATNRACRLFAAGQRDLKPCSTVNRSDERGDGQAQRKCGDMRVRLHQASHAIQGLSGQLLGSAAFNFEHNKATLSFQSAKRHFHRFFQAMKVIRLQSSGPQLRRRAALLWSSVQSRTRIPIAKLHQMESGSWPL